MQMNHFEQVREKRLLTNVSLHTETIFLQLRTVKFLFINTSTQLFDTVLKARKNVEGVYEDVSLQVLQSASYFLHLWITISSFKCWQYVKGN